MPQGLIIKGIGGFYYVKSENIIIECKVRGIFRNQKVSPLVGDYVNFDLISEYEGIITEIRERKNSIIRPPVANIDQVVLVFSTVHPQPNLILIDKLIAFLESKDLDILICINKIDLDDKKSYKEIYKTYTSAGYDVLCISAKNGLGINDVKNKLKGKVSCLAGPSGVGKSTLLNDILENEIVKTGELSQKIERGKHTTRHVELFLLKDDGYILDTPGFSMFEFDIPYDKLKYYYKEFADFNLNCKYTGCNHESEPKCAVKDAVSDGIINEDRYNNYITILNELKLKKNGY